MDFNKIAERLESETCKGKIQTYKTCSFNDKLEQYEKKKGQTFHILSSVAKGFDIPTGCKVTLFSKIVGDTHNILGKSKDSQAIVIKGPKHKYCSENHLDNIRGIGIEDDADVSEVVDGFKTFAKVISSINDRVSSINDRERRNSEAIVSMKQNIVSMKTHATTIETHVRKNNKRIKGIINLFRRKFLKEEMILKKALKHITDVKETFKSTTCCIKCTQRAYQKHLFEKGNQDMSGNIYGRRCTAGTPNNNKEQGGISVENMKKVSSAINADITDVACPQVNGKDWIDGAWLKKNNNKVVTQLIANCYDDLAFNDADSEPYFKHELCHRLVTCKDKDNEIGKDFDFVCNITGKSKTNGANIKPVPVKCEFNFDYHLGVYNEPICDIVNVTRNHAEEGPGPQLKVCDCPNEMGQVNETEKQCLTQPVLNKALGLSVCNIKELRWIELQ